MTDQEINEAIAKACGWQFVPSGDLPTEFGWKVFPESWLNPDGETKEIPDYANDLNAMHEAEKSLQGEHDLTWYLQKLSQVRFRQGESGTIACMLDRLAFATARQRAEAFLRVKGLWREK